MVHCFIIVMVLLGAVGPGPSRAESESSIMIDGVDDWKSVAALIETRIAPIPEATGLSLIRREQPAGEVLATNDGFEGREGEARWIIPIMLDSEFEQMPAWWTMRTGRARVQDDPAVDPVTEVEPIPPRSPNQAALPTRGLDENPTLRRLASEAGRATRSLIASQSTTTATNPRVSDRNHRDDAKIDDPFAMAFVSIPMVDPFDPHAPASLACWFLDADARQASLRIEGDIKAADRIVADMQSNARRMRLPSIIDLLSLRIPKGTTGFVSLCLHESWPLEAWSMRSAVESFRQDLDVRRDRLRSLAAKFSRIHELSPQQAELFSGLLATSLDRVLPIGLQIDRADWIRFENHINESFDAWKTKSGSVSDSTGLGSNSGLLNIAWDGQTILGGDDWLTSSEQFARDAQHQWLAERALTFLDDGSNSFSEGTSDEIRSGVLERMSRSMSPMLNLPLEGDGELLASTLEKEIFLWMKTRGDLDAWETSEFLAKDIATALGQAGLRDFHTGEPPRMQSRSFWPRPNISYGESFRKQIELPDGRIIGVPDISVALWPY